MYVVWRERPVKGNKKTRFLQDFIPLESVHATPWKPLACEHRGEGRVARTPLIVYSERMRGKPTQTLLCRLPAIRSCCMADRFLRAAWWYDVEQTLLKFVLADSIGRRPFDVRDRKAILAKLRKVVPPPTPAGVRDFTAYRVQKEQEYQARVARIRAEDEAFNAEQRRREQEEARRQAEERRRGERQPRQPMLTPEVIAALERLGVSYPCSAAELKAAYRRRAKETHSDQGGSDPEFIAVNAAYDIVKQYAS